MTTRRSPRWALRRPRANRHGQRLGPLAVRHDHDLPLLLRAGDDPLPVLGRDPADRLVPNRQPRLQADDPLLRDAAADQRRHRRRHRPRPGVPVRHELVDLLSVRRRGVRSAAGGGGHSRVLPRVDVPGAVAFGWDRLPSGCTSPCSGRSRSARSSRPSASSSPTRGSTSGRLQDQQPGPGGPQQHLGAARQPDVRVGLRARDPGVARSPGAW